MAKMDRDFLVPYLRDVCALHYALNKVQRASSAKDNGIYRLEHEAYPEKPAYPTLKEAPVMSYLSVFIGMIGGIAGAIAALFLIFAVGGFFGIVLGLFIGFFALIGFSSVAENMETIKNVKEKNDTSIRWYEEECQSLPSKRNAWQERQNSLPAIREEAAFLRNEKNRINELLNKVYSVNVIPVQYRDFYTAVYLYDFFKSSYEDDVSVVLGLYSLEKIKEKLDIIISNQSEILLNQYTIMAEQKQARQEQECHNRQMRQKLNNLQASADEIARSQRVIEANSDTVAFFAQATYFKNL